jgi:hypothetical protein
MQDKSKTGVIECIFHNPTITLKHRYLGDKVMAAIGIVICHFTRQKLCRAANNGDLLGEAVISASPTSSC